MEKLLKGIAMTKNSAMIPQINSAIVPTNIHEGSKLENISNFNTPTKLQPNGVNNFMTPTGNKLPLLSSLNQSPIPMNHSNNSFVGNKFPVS
jgi:hypothetical protein